MSDRQSVSAKDNVNFSVMDQVPCTGARKVNIQMRILFPLITSQEFHIQELIDGSCPCHRQNSKQLQNNELQAEIIPVSDGVDHEKVILSISVLMQNSIRLHIPQCSAWFIPK